MEKGLDVNINAELKADLQPVIESTPSALNKLFELVFGVKHAENKRIIELINAQRDKEKSSIESGLSIFDVEKKSLTRQPELETPSGSSLIKETLQNDELSNISNCAKHAARNLLDAESPTENEISQDFFNRWRNEAKLIHTESAQLIWGLILSEEIKNPDSIGLRALDILKNLTKNEANFFNDLGKYIVYGSALLCGKHISDNQIQSLADAGLLNFAGVKRSSSWLTTMLTYKEENTIEVPYIRCCDYFIHSAPSTMDFKFTYIPLTDAGMAIYRISLKNNHWDVRDAIKVLLQNKESPTDVTYYKYTSVESSTVDLDNPKYFPEIKNTKTE